MKREHQVMILSQGTKKPVKLYYMGSRGQRRTSYKSRQSRVI
jgi:hypothetical protein